MSSRAEQIAGIEAAMAAQEKLRPALGNQVVDITLKALRGRLASLRDGSNSPPDDRDGGAETTSSVPRPASSPLIVSRPPISTRAAEAERRQVTVLFADIVGFTALSEAMDHEEVAHLTNAILGELAEVVSRHDGYVDKFIGDSIMALFGAPVAHEDDAGLALRAALEMRERIVAWTGRHQTSLGRNLALHIGVNSGPVYAGHVGSAHHCSYTVLGDTVNIAARLEKAAQPGQILISKSTRQLAGRNFVYANLPPLSVKGKGQALQVFELRRARNNHSRQGRTGRLETIFIGREAELARLRSLDHEQGGGLVIVSGEAGIGKSRLVEQWRQELAERCRGTWLSGSCHPTTTAMACGPFLALLRRYLGIDRGQDEKSARRQLARFTKDYFTDPNRSSAVLAHLLAMPPTPEEDLLLRALPARELRELVFHLLTEFLDQLCRNGPVILLIEDLHWSDQTSLELLENLAARLAGRPLTMLAVSRPDSGLAPGCNSLWQAHPGRLVHLRLKPLSRKSSRTLVRRFLSLKNLPDTLSRLVVEKTEGNPFFLEETLRSLIDKGSLVRNSAGGWEPTPLIERTTVPDTLQGLLMSRLDSLPGEAKQLAQQAAVIGRSFLYRILGLIAPRNTTIDGALGAMEKVELIGRQGRAAEIEYIFRHALIQEVAYESLLVARRRELHRRVGEAMRQIFADRLGEFSGIIGEHFLLGESWESAAEFLSRSGDAASRMYAHAEARNYYAKALTALAQAGDSLEMRQQLVDVTIKLAQVSYFGRPAQEVLEYLRQARRITEQLPDPDGGRNGDRRRLAQIDFHTGQLYYSANRMQEAIGCYREVLAATPTDPEWLGSHAFAIGNVLVFQGHMARAQQLLDQAMTALVQCDNHFLLARARIMRAYVLAMTGDCRQARSEVRSALRVGCKIKAPHVIAAANLILSATQVYEDPGAGVERARQTLLRAREIAREADDAIFLYLTYGIMAWNLAMGGRYPEAEREMTQCLTMATEMGEELFMVDMFTARKAEIILGLGRTAEARATAERAIAMARTTGGIWAEAFARRTLGRILAAGRPSQREEAEFQLTESCRLYQEGENFMGVAQSHLAWGTIRQAQGDQSSAREHWQQAADFFATKGLNKRLAQVRTLMAAVCPL